MLSYHFVFNVVRAWTLFQYNVISSSSFKSISHCLFSCPHFRNEVGGEGERLIALSRSNNPNAHSTTPSNGYNGNHHASNSSGHHGLHHHHGMAKRRSSSSSSSDGVSTSSSSGLSGTPPGGNTICTHPRVASGISWTHLNPKYQAQTSINQADLRIGRFLAVFTRVCLNCGIIKFTY